MAQKKEEELPPIKRKPTNPDRLHMTYQEAVADNRKMKEYDAAMATASAKAKAELGIKEPVVTKKAGRPKKNQDEEV